MANGGMATECNWGSFSESDTRYVKLDVASERRPDRVISISHTLSSYRIIRLSSLNGIELE